MHDEGDEHGGRGDRERDHRFPPGECRGASEEGIPEAPRPAPVKRTGPPDYYVLSYALDVFLPVLLGLVMAWVVWNGADPEGWNWLRYSDSKHPEALKESLAKRVPAERKPPAKISKRPEPAPARAAGTRKAQAGKK